MPRTLNEILQIRLQETPDMDRLVQVTSSDPAIAAGVLRRVNAAYYALRREVYQVERAIMLLGFNEVCRLAYTAAVKRAFVFKNAPEAQEVYAHIMRNSVATASFAKHLGAAMNMMFQEAAFTSGLLHQMGRVALLYRTPKGYAKLWRPKGADDGPLVTPSLAAEQFVFNTTSARLAASIAQHWSLPENLATVISYYTEYHQVNNPVLKMLTLTVAAASAAAEKLFEHPDAQGPGAFVSDALIELATRRNIDAMDLAVMLDDRREDVLHFTEAMSQE